MVDLTIQEYLEDLGRAVAHGDLAIRRAYIEAIVDSNALDILIPIGEGQTILLNGVNFIPDTLPVVGELNFETELELYLPDSKEEIEELEKKHKIKITPQKMSLGLNRGLRKRKSHIKLSGTIERGGAVEILEKIKDKLADDLKKSLARQLANSNQGE